MGERVSGRRSSVINVQNKQVAAVVVTADIGRCRVMHGKFKGPTRNARNVAVFRRWAPGDGCDRLPTKERRKSVGKGIQ